jgi:hypothetical protein
MKQAWVDNTSTTNNDKKSGSDGHKKEGKFSDAAEAAKNAFLKHRQNQGDQEGPPTNLKKKMQSSGG